jgi:hypothetical protein
VYSGETLIAGAVAFFYAACRKTDEQAEKHDEVNKEVLFFDSHKASDPIIQSMANYMLRNISKTGHSTHKVLS